MCDQFLDRIRELKSAKREKCRELVQLEAKEKRAKRYRSLRSTSGPASDQASSIPLSPTPPLSRTPTPSSPLSPLFIPNHTEKGCTSYAEPVQSSGEGSSTRRCLQPSLFSIASPTYGCIREANTSNIYTLIDIYKQQKKKKPL